jgi:ACS family tartrate transporter-like MFS transporter
MMVIWGLLSAATAFVTGPWSFFTIRMLIGAAEAGLFPGILLYSQRWFLQRYRSRITAGLLIGLPLATAIGAPLSTAFLQLDGVLGLRGWQWMYLGDGIPIALIGISIWFYLTERPSEAKWLTAKERIWLDGELAMERRAIDTVRTHSIWSAMSNPKVLIMTLILAGIGMAGVGLMLFLPQIFKGQGMTNTQAGLFTGVPYVFGTIAMVVCGWISDRTKDRFWIATVTCGCAVAGLLADAILRDSLWVQAAFSLATVGFYGVKSPFWPLPSTFLTGPALVAGLAFINSLGNFAGYVGPIAVGYAKDLIGSFEIGLYVLGRRVGGINPDGLWMCVLDATHRGNGKISRSALNDRTR